ncbi:HAD hydrolase family protein [Ostreibacterium oceani]|uniref:HAD hydrolase family protein n=1 Tax=Ostreibacterium oceani TaxID=2654998 RepID=A0A6N7ETV5_9GAMM|nr:HAD hydrolase family protein [Ostreibacterium oceani]MPV86244.1 HAD hydrolase family protein [Ostreibacterium oceani]
MLSDRAQIQNRSKSFKANAVQLALLHNLLAIDADTAKQRVLFIGDSHNDAVMFNYFDLSVGVANVMDCIETLAHRPKYITQQTERQGFVELAEWLLDNQSDEEKHHLI